MEFQKRFKDFLEKRKIEPTEIATALNLSQKKIESFLSGKTQPSGKVLFRICKYLNVSSDYLIGLSDSTKFKNRWGKDLDK